MSAVVLSDADAAMMDFDGAHPAHTPDNSWTMEVSDSDAAIEVEVDMEQPDTLTEYEMGEEYETYADDAIDVELYDAAAEAVAIGSPLDLDVLPAAPIESTFVEVAFPLTTPTLDAAIPFFDVSVPPAVPEQASSHFGALPSSAVLPPDESVIHEPAAVPLPASTSLVPVDLPQHDVSPSIFPPSDTLIQPEEIPPRTETSGPLVIVEPVIGHAAFTQDPQVPILSTVEHPRELEGHHNDVEGGIPHETEEQPDAAAAEAEVADAYNPNQSRFAFEGNEEQAEPPQSVLLSLASSEPLYYAFCHPEHEPQDLPIVMESNPDLFYSPIIDLFEALRREEAISQLPNAFDGNMTIEAYDLDLTISEDNTWAKEVQLHDLALLHEGCGLSGPLRVRIYFKAYYFRARYQQLRDHVARLTLSDEATEAPTTVALGEEASTHEQLHTDAAVSELGQQAHAHEEAELDDSDADGTNEDDGYHQVSGPEATALEDEDEYPDVLAEPDDNGTADKTELDADLVHREAIIDGEGEFDDGEGEGEYGPAAEEPTEYEDVAGYHEDDEERAEEDPEFYEDAQGLGEVEDGLGVSEEAHEEEVAGDTPLFVPEQVAANGGVRGAEYAVPPEAEDGHDDGEHDANAGILPPAESLANIGANDLQTTITTNEASADLITEGFDTANADDAFDDEFDADDALETTVFDEPVPLPDDRSSVTLDDEVLINPAASSEPRSEPVRRASTGVSKRGFDEVEAEDEVDHEATGGSPGSKRVRAA